jgi:hypothetical protein
LVHFPSLEDNGPGKSATTLDGYMFRPPASGTHPALVFLHGCDGLFNRATGLIGCRERDWAAALTPRGYIVLRSTSFGPRITAKCARNGASIASLPEAASRRLRSAVVPAGTAVCGRRSSRGHRLVARWRSRVIITESGKSQRWVVYRPFFRESPPRVGCSGCRICHCRDGVEVADLVRDRQMPYSPHQVLARSLCLYGIAGNIRALQKVYRAVVRYWCEMPRSRSWAGPHLTWGVLGQIKERTP